jgi:RHS repeat-associated protein
MRFLVIFVILLIVSISSSSAKEVSIPQLFEVEKQAISFESPGKEVYYYAGSKLIAVDNKYQYQDRLGSDFNSRSLPFGKSLKINNRFSFTGKELDSDLYYFNARYYDSDLSKFTSIDPVKDNHAYSYVNNNPMNYVDPTGKVSVFFSEGFPENSGRMISSMEGHIKNYFANAFFVESLGIDIENSEDILNVELLWTEDKLKFSGQMHMTGNKLTLNVRNSGLFRFSKNSHGELSVVDLAPIGKITLAHELQHKIDIDAGKVPLTTKYWEISQKNPKKDSIIMPAKEARLYFKERFEFEKNAYNKALSEIERLYNGCGIEFSEYTKMRKRSLNGLGTETQKYEDLMESFSHLGEEDTVKMKLN